MLNTLTSLRTLLFGLFLIMLGSGLQGTLLSLRSSFEGFSPLVTGFIMSGYYIGYLIGSMWVTKITHEVGHIRVFAAMAAIASGTILLHVVFVNPVAWLLFRVVTGFCFVGIFIIVESWINHFSSNALRGKILAAYMVIQLLGSGLGQLLLDVDDPHGFTLFIVVSVVISMASVPILLSNTTQAPVVSQPPQLKMRNLFKSAPLGMVGALMVGIASGAFWGVGAVYASQLGLSVSNIGLFMAAVIFGGMLFQWPLGWLSDRVPRQKVIAGVALAAAFVSLALLLLGNNVFSTFLFLSLVFGGLSLPLYSILSAYTNDHVPMKEMIKATSTLILVYGVGAIIGPILGGMMLSALGTAGFFSMQAMVFVVLGSYAFRLEIVAPEEVMEESVPTVPLPSRPSLVSAVAVAETMQEALDTDTSTGTRAEDEIPDIEPDDRDTPGLGEDEDRPDRG
ncbi:MFS transporter [Nitrospina watsonii]|uniref:Major facilitator superfamily MFS_1 n=1 Tax=Nitrospina watsonii TaxID=1323948 RepID=A0ABN8VVN5_9BACT|nr:MFS transporter [Nitrospina watsonii]CAI2716894.1 Major facilitator superfamily MFS_1 [Nitrospina watsonii]